MDFTADELDRIASWLRDMPDVTVSLSDISRVRGYKQDPARIVPFAHARKLRLHLDRARDVAFLEAFQDLEELMVHVQCVLDLPALSKLRMLVVHERSCRSIGADWPRCAGGPAPPRRRAAHRSRRSARAPLPLRRCERANLDAIAALPLRGLSLAGVEEDTALSPLAGNTTIEMLESSVHSPAQVAAVARLPLRNLRIWIPDGVGPDLVEPLRGHPTLERVMVGGFGWKAVRDRLLETGFSEGGIGDWPTD